MIRWERQEDGGWQGFSGELLVATVTKDESAEREQWLWSITALKRPKGWRKGAGHRTSWIDARRAAEEYWAKWLEQAALRADVMQLASRSSPKNARPGRANRQRAECTSPMLGAMPTPTDPRDCGPDHSRMFVLPRA